MIKEGYHYQYMQNTLQLNQGVNAKGIPLFSEVGQLAGISDTDWSWSTLFFDMDNDGWKDLFISNGLRRDIQNKDAWTTINDHLRKGDKLTFMQMQSFFPEARLQNYTFQNNQQLGFTNVSSYSGIDFQGFSNGAAYADLDQDGDLDLVLNNLDDPALIYENLASTIHQSQHHYLQIQLRGWEDNFFGLGAKVTLNNGDQQQFQKLTAARGFQSAADQILHFGIGKHEKIDKITIAWPNGTHQQLTDVQADQRILIDQKDAAPMLKVATHTSSEPLLHPVQLFQHVHQEEALDDFSHERLLPFKLSNQGPCMAVGDVNGDLLEDFFVRGGKGYSGALFVQQANGTFHEQSILFWEQDQRYEDADALFFDADQDQDLDLYVVSGSNEYEENSPWLQDRLYINDGKGNFTHAVLPDIRTSGSCVASADVDQDGDLDLFVGGATIPGAYPSAPPSYLLINEEGSFTYREVGTPGMVSDAVWADHDQDGDLIIVGQWMPLTFFENHKGELLSNETLTIHNTNEQDTISDGLLATAGWWNCITAADLDQDGDLDFVLGNVGLNTRFSASAEEPVEIYVRDFDGNGSLEAIMGYTQSGKLYPVPGRDKLLDQIPSWKSKFPDYHTFAQATMGSVLDGEPLDSIMHLQVRQLASSILYNEGNHIFTQQILPVEAQLSSVNDVVVEDVNHDGLMDLVLAGNHDGWEVEFSRNDASRGLLLLGERNRVFQPLLLKESGFMASDDVRTLRCFIG